MPKAKISGWFQFCPKLFSCVALLGVLSGCSAGHVLNTIILTEEIKRSEPESPRPVKNRYEPVILASNENSIKINYLSVGPNAEHEQVTQMISDHCDGSYTETNRVELKGYTTIDAECTHVTDSLQ